MFERLRWLAEGADGAGSGAAPPPGDGGKGSAAPGDAGGGKDAGDRKTVIGADGKDGKSDAGAKGAEAKAKDGAADDYVVKLPEGMKETDVSKEQLGAFTKFAKESGLSAEQASKAMGYWKSLNDAESAKWAAQDQAWYGQLEKDAEFGGANLKASEAALQTALKRFDTDGSLAKDLASYGLENLPSLAKFIARVGKAAGEDKAAAPKDGNGAGKKLSGTERRKAFYSDMGDKPATE